MNDDIKIKAIMVYFQHWGKDEIKAEYDLKAFINTIERIKTIFVSRDTDFVAQVRFKTSLAASLSFFKNHMIAMNMINDIANILLSGMGGCSPIIPIRNNHDVKLAKMLNLKASAIPWKLDEKELRSVNAIVALM